MLETDKSAEERFKPPTSHQIGSLFGEMNLLIPGMFAYSNTLGLLLSVAKIFKRLGFFLDL
jgi:hypothetical protein